MSTHYSRIHGNLNMTDKEAPLHRLQSRINELEHQLSEAKQALQALAPYQSSDGSLSPYSSLNTTSPSLLEAIFESSQVGIAVIDGADLTIRMANPAFINLTPYPSVHPAGRKWSEVWDTGQGFQLEPLLRHVLRTGEVVRTDRHLYRFPDESVHYYTLSLSLLNFSGHPAVLAVISENTSLVQAHRRAEDELEKRKQADFARQQSEEHFRQLANAMPQLVWTANSEGAIEYYNQRYTEYNGIAPQSSEEWAWSPALHPDDLQPTLEAWTRSVKTGDMYQIEHRVMMADGAFRWHLSRGIPARGPDGQVVKWYGTATDIHDYKQAEQALENREERLRRMMEASQVGILVLQPNGKIIDINDAALQMWGLARADFERLSPSWREAGIANLSPEDLALVQTLLKERQVGPVERQLRRWDGTPYWVMVSAVQLDVHGDEIVAFIVDITEQKQAEAALQEYAEQLEQRNLALEEFAFIASHDLQEPLRKIDAFGRILLASSENKLDEQERNYLQRMRNASSRMQAMVKGLLELSRVTTQGASFTQVDLNQVAAAVVSDLEVTINRTHGKVEIHPLPTLHADPVQMRQLLQNLVSNGLKFHHLGQSPVVRVYAEDDGGGQVVIKVEDNGIGFDPTLVDKMFEPFQRLVSRTEFEGSGMGLAICRKIINRHGGTISAHSTPDQGAVFTICLPK